MSNIFNKKNKIENTTYDDVSSLSHTKWNCKYHIVFTPNVNVKIKLIEKFKIKLIKFYQFF